MFISLLTNIHTLIPVFVASREASSNGLNIGLNATVNAQSTIRPERPNSKNNALKSSTTTDLKIKHVVEKLPLI